MVSFTTTALAVLALSSSIFAAPIEQKENALAKRFSGARMTYYYTGVGLGACGNYHPDSDWTVALNSAQYGGGYPGPECGKTITITYNGMTAQATIQDECPTCPYGGLDLSPGLMEHFGAIGNGVIYGDWEYGSGAAAPATTSQAPTSTYVAPTSTYVAPTTTWTPEPSTSTTPTSTYTPPTSTYVAPTTSSTPTPSSSSVAPITSSSTLISSVVESSAASSSVASSSSSVASSSLAVSSVASATRTISAAALISSASTTAASGTATASATASQSASTTGQDGNLEMLAEVIINFGRLVIEAA